MYKLISRQVMDQLYISLILQEDNILKIVPLDIHNQDFLDIITKYKEDQSYIDFSESTSEGIDFFNSLIG